MALALNALSKVVEPGEAVPLLERALAIDRRVLGTTPRDGDDRSEPRRSARRDTPKRGGGPARYGRIGRVPRNGRPDHPRTAVAASILGYACEVKGDRKQAEQMYRLALDIDRRVYGPEDAQTRNDARVLNEFLKSAPR